MSDEPSSNERAKVFDARLIGRYGVLKVLGRGGMGEVLKAVDPERNCHVAIKILDRHASKDPDLVNRFEREATAVFTLDHPNIAKIYGMEVDDNGKPFIVMEFIDGVPLDRYLKENTSVPFSVLTDFIIQATRGLEAAFRRSIIHRDIKPGNILVTGPGQNQIKIIDFGLAKSLWDTSMASGKGVVIGTPRYIAPEQALGRTVDHRSDIYSLGATFYELVTRQPPFDGDTSMAIMLKHINAPLVPPYLINPQVPNDISEIICKMMEKDPLDRYQDYEPLLRDLESAKIHRMAKERRLPAAPPPDEGPDPDTGRSAAMLDTGPKPSQYLDEGIAGVDLTDLPESPRQTSRLHLWVIGAVVLLAAVTTMLALTTPHTESSPQNRRAWLVDALKRSFSREDRAKKEQERRERLAAEDANNVETTRKRMDAIIPKIIEYRKDPANRGRIPRIRDLRATGVLTPEGAQDAWGNDFVSNSARGILLSPGRDGIEGTDDDFVYLIDGTPQKIPLPLYPDDFASNAQVPEEDF